VSEFTELDRRLTAESRARAAACRREHYGQWRVIAREGNASAFNGYRWQRSRYSAVRCFAAGCGRVWRTDAAYVAELPDAAEEGTR
jgi:hypothetical protein